MSRSRKHIAHPLYWPTWLGMGLFWSLAQLPWGMQAGLARLLGNLAWAVFPFRRRVILTNLRLAFPEKTEAERRGLARAHYVAIAFGLFETCIAWWGPERVVPRFVIEGGEHLDRLRAAKRGALLLTAHFTTLELTGRMLLTPHPFGCLYREPNNPVLAWKMRRRRETEMPCAIHFDDLRGLIRALRQGHHIWYAPDQAKRTKFSEILPFFGEPAITNTATGRIAEMSGAAVVPFFGHRQADGTFRIQILPPLEDFPTADPNADAVRVNRILEAFIREAPDQYFWIHKRYKARGEGYADVYRK